MGYLANTTGATFFNLIFWVALFSYFLVTLSQQRRDQFQHRTLCRGVNAIGTRDWAFCGGALHSFPRRDLPILRITTDTICTRDDKRPSHQSTLQSPAERHRTFCRGVSAFTRVLAFCGGAFVYQTIGAHSTIGPWPTVFFGTCATPDSVGYFSHSPDFLPWGQFHLVNSTNTERSLLRWGTGTF